MTYWTNFKTGTKSLGLCITEFGKSSIKTIFGLSTQSSDEYFETDKNSNSWDVWPIKKSLSLSTGLIHSEISMPNFLQTTFTVVVLPQPVGPVIKSIDEFYKLIN